MNQATRTQKLAELHKLVTAYTPQAHEQNLLPKDSPALAWFEQFKYLDPVGWAADPNKIPYVAATALVDSYSCLPRRPDMAFTYLWTATNSCYNDLFMMSPGVSEALGDVKAIDRSLVQIQTRLQARIELPAESSPAIEFSTPEDITLAFISCLPDKTLHFVASYILKGMAIEKHNDGATPTGQIRKIHVSSSYSSFKKRFPAIANNIYWTYAEAYSNLCTITEAPDKTDLEFGITDTEKARKITHALGLEIKDILTRMPTVTQFDEKGNAKGAIPSMSTDIQRLEFLVFCFLYAARNNSAHGNVASRVNSIYSNSASIVATTWLFLFGYFYLSMILLCMGSIEPDDMHVHYLNARLLTSK